MFSILLIGCGGIGSYFAATLKNVINAEQFAAPPQVTVVDDDSVELKNIKYQNFTNEDIGEDKSEAIGTRYGYDHILGRISPLKLDPKQYKLIVCAVDNAQTRLDLYKLWAEHGTYFIDLRAVGRILTVVTPGVPMSTLPSKEDREKILTELNDTLKGADTGSGSCQLAYELDAGVIQLGNQIVAPMGVQVLLNVIRGEKPRRVHIQRI